MFGFRVSKLWSEGRIIDSDCWVTLVRVSTVQMHIFIFIDVAAV